MSSPKLSEADFIREFEALGAKALARKIGGSERGVLQRRARVEAKIGRQLTSPHSHTGATRHGIAHPHRLNVSIPEGIVLVASDGHYWPGPATTAHRAFLFLIKELRPQAVIMNGDALDGARISRHAPIGWEKRPTLIEELEACQERLAEIELATPRRIPLFWPLGNHDGRLETRIATVLPELAKLKGVHLKDHFGARWQACWSTWINNGGLVVKHRFKGGRHAAANNTTFAGTSIATGHTHQLTMSAFPDYRGIRWGVETGCLAEAFGEQFTDYTEDNPRFWQSGFAVFTFHKGELLQPELVRVYDANHVDFRGSLIRV